MATQFDEWVTRLARSCGATEVVDENLVRVDASDCPRLDIAGAPKEARLLIRNVGVNHRTFTVVVQSPPRDWQPSGEDPRTRLPEEVEIEGAALLERLSFEAAPRRVTLRLSACREAVTVAGNSPSQLSIIGGKAKLDSPAPKSLLLTDVVLHFKRILSPTSVQLKGEVSIRGSRDHFFEARHVTHVAEGTAIVDTRAKSVFLGHIRSLGGADSPVSLSMRSSVISLLTLPPQSTLTLDDQGIIHFLGGHRRSEPEVRELRLRSTGPRNKFGVAKAWVSGRITGLALEPSRNFDLQLEVREGGQVDAASGEATLVASPSSVCIGDKDGAFRPSTVKAAKDAELQDINVYELDLGDLANLGEAYRFSPWLPRAARHRRKQEDAMSVGTANPALQVRRRAYFWARLAQLLPKTHATGSVQSKVRYSAARARRKSLPLWSYERFLLALYSIAGYGERITLPLAWMVAVSALGAVLMEGAVWEADCCDRIVELFKALGGLLVSPLTFFRFIAPLVTEGMDTGIRVTVTILNTLLLFFSLTAVRRVTKAE